MREEALRNHYKSKATQYYYYFIMLLLHKCAWKMTIGRLTKKQHKCNLIKYAKTRQKKKHTLKMYKWKDQKLRL